MMGGESVEQWQKRMEDSHGVDEYDLGRVRFVRLLHCLQKVNIISNEERAVCRVVETVAKKDSPDFERQLMSIADETIPSTLQPEVPDKGDTPLQLALKHWTKNDDCDVFKICAEASDNDIELVASDVLSWRYTVNNLKHIGGVNLWQAFSRAMLRSRQVDIVLFFISKYADEIEKMPPITDEHRAELQGDPRVVLAFITVRPMSESTMAWLAQSKAWFEGSVPVAFTEKIVTKEFLKNPRLVKVSTIVLWRLSRRKQKFFALPKENSANTQVL